MNNYVDLSTKSLMIAGVVFLVIVIFSKLGFDYSSDGTGTKEERSTYTTIMYSVLIGLVCALLTLVIIKQICKSGSCDILTDD